MIFTLIAGALAGWGARPSETRVAEILAGVIGEENLKSPANRRVAALLATMFLAALALWILRVDGRPVLFVLAAAVGYYQEPIREAILNRKS